MSSSLRRHILREDPSSCVRKQVVPGEGGMGRGFLYRGLYRGISLGGHLLREEAG
jgi:hypothetical protein